VSLSQTIDKDHLPRLLSKLIVHADAQIPPLVPGIRSLLLTGGASLLREAAETEHMRKQQDNTGGRTLQRLVFNRQTRARDRNTSVVDITRAMELRGRAVRPPRVPRFLPSLFQELVVMNGHRFATFCLLFDKTNNRIITGSDDYLIKVWSAQSGYLIFTFRGHSSVVTYMDLSPDNTMLATASNDGIIRVWDLKTATPIAVLPTGNPARNRKNITTVSFSPSPIPQIRYLIATSLDGYTWVWKYDRDIKKFQAKPTMLNCKTFNDSKLKCSTWNYTGSQFAVAGTDLFIRVFSTIQGGPEAIKAGKRRKSYDKSKTNAQENKQVDGACASSGANAAIASASASSTFLIRNDWGDPVPVAHLDGHLGVVTSLSYSRFGNRLLSGSVDGFIRIWKYDQQSKMWTSIAIDIRNEHHQAEATITEARHMMPSPQTGASATVPNPSLSQSSEFTNTMEIDGSNVVPTVDEAGQDSTADPTNTNPATEDEPRITPLMAIWSLDDSAVILTTTLGEVKIFDSKTGEWIHTLKGHVRGTPIYVVDVHPQDGNILMTAGYDGQVILWDIAQGVKIKTWMYPEHEFLDGRFSPDGLMFAVTDQEGKCTLFGAGLNPDDYKDARSFAEQTFWSDYAAVRYDGDFNVVDDTSQVAPHLMERTPILDTNGRDYAKQKGPRFGLDLPVNLLPGALQQEEHKRLAILEQELENLAGQTLTVLPTTDKRKLYKRRRDFILEDDDDDDDPMTTEVPIVPLPNDSSGEEYAGGAASASSSSDSDEDDSDLAQDMADDLPAADFVVNDDDDDEYFAAGQRKRRTTSSSGTVKRRSASDRKRRAARPRKRLRLRSDDDDEDDIDDDIDDEEEEEEEELEFDDDSDDDDQPSSSTRRAKRSQAGSSNKASSSKNQRSARPKSFANDDYPSDENLESSSDDDDEGVFSGSSAGGSFSGVPPSVPVVGESMTVKKKQWRGNGRKKGKAVLRDETAIELQSWLPSDWIKTNEPRKTPYHPQIGDYVAYLRQGHSHYLNETPLRPKLDLKLAPFLKDPSLAWVTFGRVSRITYNVGPPTWCTITLEEQILPSSYGYTPDPPFVPSRRRFDVEFHDLGDVPDFIVLYAVFQEGMNAQYAVGDQIWTTFDDNAYSGTITEQVVEDQAFPESLWMAFEVTWPSNDTTNLSPWEMQREENEESSNQESIPEDEYERIHEVIQHLLQMEELQIFKSSVDFAEYPDYCKTIAYPMCLESIGERIASGYYRRSRAVQFDIELLEKNALAYNDPSSGIAMFAKHLSRIYKTSVNNPSKPLPNELQVKASRRDEDDEFDGSGSDDEHIDVDSDPDLDIDVEEEEEIEDDDAFLDDETSGEEGRTSSRSRTSSRPTRSTRKSNGSRKPPSSSRKVAVPNGNSGPSGSSGSSGLRGRSTRRRTRKSSDGDGDGDDGEWGRPRSRRRRNIPQSTRRQRTEEDGEEEGGATIDEIEDESFAGEDEYPKRRNGSSYDEVEEDDGDMDDFVGEPAAGTTTTTRSTRSRRKKTRIADSDDDYS
ncbi:Bromodomain and WD repeat-containing protein 1, partial [Lunasporangiospora selenospora]